jgi:hypothetical protein
VNLTKEIKPDRAITPSITKRENKTTNKKSEKNENEQTKEK